MKTLLIDADIIMFRFAFRHQTTIEWSEDVVTVECDEEAAIADLNRFILRLLIQCKCVKYSLCFTHTINFRYSIFSEYKAARSKNTPPLLLSILKQYMKDNHPWMEQKYLEADDLMGILATEKPKEYILATIDKDFKTLPVRLFNWDKDKRPKLISKKEADYWFHYQWLIGDTTDGFKGCWRIGDKKARGILDKRKPSEWTTAVVETYADKCYSWKEIITQARMARILRHTDWDFESKEVILWEPNC